MTARTARIYGPGRYVMHNGALRKVPMGSLAIACEMCRWCVFIPRDHTYAESLRKDHLGSAHLSALTSGAAVINPELTDA